MAIRKDYIHHVPASFESRSYGGDTKVDHIVYKGTSAEIAAEIARSVQTNLDSGASTQIVLTPISPMAIIDLTDQKAVTT